MWFKDVITHNIYIYWCIKLYDGTMNDTIYTNIQEAHHIKNIIMKVLIILLKNIYFILVL